MTVTKLTLAWRDDTLKRIWLSDSQRPLIGFMKKKRIDCDWRFVVGPVEVRAERS